MDLSFFKAKILRLLTSKFMINAANIPKKSSVVAVSSFSPKNLTVSRNSFVDLCCKLIKSFSSPSVSSIMLCRFPKKVVFRDQAYEARFKGALSLFWRYCQNASVTTGYSSRLSSRSSPRLRLASNFDEERERGRNTCVARNSTVYNGKCMGAKKNIYSNQCFSLLIKLFTTVMFLW